METNKTHQYTSCGSQATSAKKITIVLNGQECTFEIDQPCDEVAPGFDDEGPLLLCRKGKSFFVVRPRAET